METFALQEYQYPLYGDEIRKKSKITREQAYPWDCEEDVLFDGRELVTRYLFHGNK